MGCYDEAVLQQHMLLSMVPYGIILRRCLLSPPSHAYSCVTCCRPLPSAARHPLPVIRCLLLLQKLPPNLVDCRHRHCPLSLHRSPPYCLSRCTIRRSLSTQQHRRRRHWCNPLLTPTALIALSASHYPLLSCCLPTAAIVATTPSLL
jgi:hypothetical protein